MEVVNTAYCNTLDPNTLTRTTELSYKNEGQIFHSSIGASPVVQALLVFLI